MMRLTPEVRETFRAGARLRRACLLAVLVGGLLVPAVADAQNFSELFDVAPAGRRAAAPDEGVELSAVLSSWADAPQDALLAITIRLPDGTVTYGQDDTAPKPTRITIDEHPDLEPRDELFTPDRQPEIEQDAVFNKPVGKFKKQVTYSRRYRIREGADLANLKVDGKIEFLICDDQNCTPLKREFTAELKTGGGAAGPPELPASEASGGSASGREARLGPSGPAGSSELAQRSSGDTLQESAAEDAPAESATENAPATDIFRGGYRMTPTRRSGGQQRPDPLRLTFELSPLSAKAGDKVTLAVSMELDEGWHTYGLSPAEEQLETPTEFSLDGLDRLEPAGEWEASPEPKLHRTDVGQSMQHATQVNWRRTFHVQQDGPVGVAGSIVYQVCEKVCLPPKSIEFGLGSLQTADHVAEAKPFESSAAGRSLTTGAGASGEGAAGLGATGALDNGLNFEIEGNEEKSLGQVLGLALLGGLLLNIMPCVLPVLAIKLLSVVKQSGEDRRRILQINLMYTLGVVSVFMLLGALIASAVVAGGGLFQLPWFRIATVVLLFVVGLNLLGAFEFTLPGALGAAASSGKREGLTGAFLGGVFTTLLATPCSTGPMAAASFWSLTQPAPVILLVWGTIGVGMALPYLLVGFFPGAAKLIPPPGMWMVRFKQFSGFAMFGAALFYFPSIDAGDQYPVLIALFGLALGLWMIGGLYDAESPPGKKMLVRLCAAVICGGTLLVANALRTTTAGANTIAAAAGTAAADGSPVDFAERGGPSTGAPLRSQGVSAPAAVPSNPSAVKAPGTESLNPGGASAGGELVGHAELPWEPFSEERLFELRKTGQPAIIDFTATWCANCITNEQVALNTPETVKFARERNVAALVADYTNQSPEIEKWLNRFGAVTVPLTVIVPADPNQNLIPLPGVYSREQLLEKLRIAAPEIVPTSAAIPSTEAAVTVESTPTP